MQAGDTCKGTLDIECERDWSVSLGTRLGDATDRILKIIFLLSGIFLGKADSHIVGLRMYYKPIKFNQIRWSHF